jgi:hypothetical protein
LLHPTQLNRLKAMLLEISTLTLSQNLARFGKLNQDRVLWIINQAQL